MKEKNLLIIRPRSPAYTGLALALRTYGHYNPILGLSPNSFCIGFADFHPIKFED